MKLIHELEIWSKPNKILSIDFGKEFVNDFKKSNDNNWSNKYLIGVSFIPDRTDVENLKLLLDNGEINYFDFVKFCRKYNYQEDIYSIEIAAKFLEYLYGRVVAWLHLPVDEEQLLIQEILLVLKSHDLIIIDPHYLFCILR